jgi:hypothetical protein
VATKESARTKAALAAIGDPSGKPGSPGVLDQIASVLNALWGTGPAARPSTLGEATGEKTPPKPKKAKKKKADTTASTDTTELSAEQAFGLLAQGLVNEDQAMTSQVQQMIEGQVPGQTGQAAAPSGAAILQANQPAAGSASDWLNQNIAAANAADSPMQQAMNNYATAYGQGEALQQGAIQQMGAANTAMLETAPEQAYVSLLQPGAGYYKYLTPAEIQQLSPAMQYALQQAGVGVGEGSPIPTPKGGWPKSITGGKAASTSPASALFGTPATAAATNPATGALSSASTTNPFG